MRVRLKNRLGQLFRRCTQLGVVAFVAFAALGGWWRNYKLAHNNARLVGLIEGDDAEQMYRGYEGTLALWDGVSGANPEKEDTLRASFDFLGMTWSGTFFGLETADPILALSMMLSGALPDGAAWARLLSSACVAIFVALLLGKVFCSHICPMRLLFEVGQVIRAGLLAIGVPLPFVRSDVRFGGWVFLGGILATLFSGVAVWWVLLPYLGASAELYWSIAVGGTTGLIAVPLALLMTDILMAPGYFCHNLCPQGFLLEQLARLASFRVEANQSVACPSNCHVCEMVCPYHLNPRDDLHRPSCDNCGKCTVSCPSQKLDRKFRLPVLQNIVSALVLGASLGLTTLGFSGDAHAHHNKGLPHYGYYENYPQVPTEEYIIIDGRWEMGSTVFNFQGYERKDADTPNDVKIFVYLYDLEKDRAYMGPVEFEILSEGEVITSFKREKVDEEQIYSTRETMPVTGNYTLRARVLGVEDLDEAPVVDLEFYIDLDEGGVSWPIVLGLTLPLIPLFGIVIAGRSRRGRSRSMKSKGLHGR